MSFWRGGFRRDLAPAAAPALDDDGDEVRLLHRPHTLDELWDRDGMWLLDTEHDERLRHVVGQFGLVVEIQLFEAFQDVVEPAQAGPPLLFPAVQHG